MAKRLRKEREKQLIQRQQHEDVLNGMLQYSKKRFKKFDEVIIQLCENKDLALFFNTDKRMRKINECFNYFSGKHNPHVKESLRDIFINLDQCSSLVADESLIQAVFNAFKFRENWRKDIFKWRPVSKQGQIQFKELASHLFCKYEVPEFLNKAFYETENTLFINWFIHLGTGGKVKELKDVPIPFTQKMAHYFTQAPAKLNVKEALRWAQVKGLGGHETAAEKVAYSRLATKPFGEEIFWESFLHLVIRDGMFNYDKLSELIDYVREVKREVPAYNLKGRTAQSLIRHSDAWHGQYAQVKGNMFWKPCGIDGFKHERKTEIVKLEELTEAKKLIEEGTAMKHCVASYAHYCAQGKSAIFSLRKYSGGVLNDIMATIEVSVFLKRIVQAKGKMNKPISDEAKKYMESWAAKNTLTINPYL